MGALLDGELELPERGQVEEHLENCQACAGSLKRLQALSHALHSHSLTFEPSAGFEERIVKSLRQEAQVTPVRVRSQIWRWAGLAACALLAISLTWNLLERRSANRNAELIASEVVSSHVRSLMGNHLFDVPSTDQHTVKPWFNGKLDFSPNVKDFSTDGFRLVGGRLDYIAGRPVAALVFQHNQHMINLFTWPGSEGTIKPTADGTHNGYSSVHWSDSGMSYWAVGDIPPPTLMDFALLYLK